MNTKFKKVHLHNFGSYGDTTITLEDKGYCLVFGENHFKKDNAISNGCGKSMLWSAVCFAITGETIQGIHSNLKNINIDEKLAYVELDLVVNNIPYKITRYIEPKSDLKIIVNGEDKSGKGIRESEQILVDYMPDLTKDLIASTILIGQGMPNKFSSFSPSGRKELLEKLTKSDFMIEDIKVRINNRLDILNKELLDYKNNIIITQTTLNNKKDILNKLIEEKDNFVSIDYDIEIPKYTDLVKNIELEISNLKNDIELKNKLIDQYNQYTSDVNKVKQQEYENLSKAYYEEKEKLIAETSSLNATIKTLQAEIKKIQDIKEVCPTCGRPFEGIVKPSTKDQETALKNNQILLEGYQAKLNLATLTFDNNTRELTEKYNTQLNKFENDKKSLNNQVASLNSTINQKQTLLIEYKEELAKLIISNEHTEAAWKKLCDDIDVATAETNNLSAQLDELTNKATTLQEHLDVVNKMNTLAKRDFRGYLLQNILKYINTKCKEYSQIVFGTDELDVYLDGNSLDISYCNKLLENLSGGERQRVDLILQFAIRDTLSKFLNYQSNILILDEIFDNLDRKATNEILNLISTKLDNIESIFIISHHSDELNIPYDSELKVIKNELGISLIKE